MKIAQISPLYESVPPKAYGGTERVVSYLTESLIKFGHDVTLFASGDSLTNAKLISSVNQSLRLSPDVEDPLAHHLVQLQEVIERADEFDILHFHTDYLHFPFTNNSSHAYVTTLHGRLDIPDLQFVYHKFRDQPLISISDAQRMPVPYANWLTTIYHGLPLNLYRKGEGKGDYLVFLGRISREKRPDRAIEIAGRAGFKLKIAAKIDKADRAYYSSIKHLIEQPHVEFLGEVGETEKGKLLADAKALLFPIDWPEPFGMVMIESIACGTPVIAYKNGSVPEIISDGQTGFIVSDIGEAVKAVSRIGELDRTRIRNIFEERYSADVMAESYIDIYKSLLTNKERRSLENSKQPRKVCHAQLAAIEGLRFDKSLLT